MTSPVVRSAVVRFLLGSVIALVVLAGGTFVITRQIAADQALEEAQLRSSVFARSVAAPLIAEGVRSGDTPTLHALDMVMRARMKDGSIVHIIIWSQDGRVIWADTPVLAGRRFVLSGAVQALFTSGGVDAKFSHLSEPEHFGRVADLPLLEVNVSARDRDGVPFVFESYWSGERVRQQQDAILRELIPLTLGALFLFQLAVLPLALSLARRVDRAQVERARMLRHALSASDLERRRLARDLHDGVVQDLSGLGYALPALSDQASVDPQQAGQVLEQIGQVIRRDIAALRTMMTDIYPADLRGAGLSAAMNDLAGTAREAGLGVTLRIGPGVADLGAQVGELVCRVTREGLRNVVRHAEADNAAVYAHLESGTVVVSVSDDGRGIGERSARAGHVGLRLLGDTVRDLGGELWIDDVPTGGARLTAFFPATFLTTDGRHGAAGSQGFRKHVSSLSGYVRYRMSSSTGV